METTIHTSGPVGLTASEIEPWRRVPVSIVADLAPDIGLIDPAIRPLCPPGQQPKLFGRAVTAVCEPPDFGAVIHALDIVGRGDVLVIAAGGSAACAMIGDILGGHLRSRGCAGIVCDGAVRDVGALAEFTDFSVYARHIRPRGPTSAERGAINVAAMVGGRLVNPGDIIIGDDNGLVALTPESIRNLLGDAQAKMAQEQRWIADLASGKSVAEVFDLVSPVVRGSLQVS